MAFLITIFYIYSNKQQGNQKGEPMKKIKFNKQGSEKTRTAARRKSRNLGGKGRSGGNIKPCGIGGKGGFGGDGGNIKSL